VAIVDMIVKLFSLISCLIAVSSKVKCTVVLQGGAFDLLHVRDGYKLVST
jgi:hypothetical protein